MTVSSVPQGPLSVGNVVSAGLRLYSNHFKPYFGMALIATLWVLVPFLVGAVVAGFLAFMPNPESLFLLLTPAWLLLLIYCFGRYLAGAAAISRLAFGELVNQPDTAKNARRFTNSRLWSFLWQSVLLGLLYTAIFIGVYIVLAIIVFGVVAVTGTAGIFSGNVDSFANNPGVILAGVLLILLLIALLASFFVWLGARFSVADMPLAIEAEATAGSAINRSWELTKKNAWRVALILLITFLITLPILTFSQILQSSLQTILTGAIPSTAVAFTVTLAMITYALSFLVNVFMLPLWQAIKAVIYYDLCSRREGLGLELRDRQI